MGTAFARNRARADDVRRDDRRNHQDYAVIRSDDDFHNL